MIRLFTTYCWGIIWVGVLICWVIFPSLLPVSSGWCSVSVGEDEQTQCCFQLRVKTYGTACYVAVSLQVKS